MIQHWPWVDHGGYQLPNYFVLKMKKRMNLNWKKKQKYSKKL